MTLFPLLPLLVALAAAPAQAQTSPTAGQPRSAASARQLSLAQGEVLEVDRAEKRVVIKHGRIPSLGMDPMTMEFAVADARLLASLKPGDKIRFAASYRDGDYMITRAEAVKGHVGQRPKTP